MAPVTRTKASDTTQMMTVAATAMAALTPLLRFPSFTSALRKRSGAAETLRPSRNRLMSRRSSLTDW